jgi:hypothetical protein
MAIALSIIESAKQKIAGIPEYIIVSVQNVSNAIVYYTFDGSPIDTSGHSPSTLIMEHAPGDPLNGVIFLPANVNILDLNILGVGTDLGDTAEFYRRYGLDKRNIGIGRPGIGKPVEGGSGYTNTPSPNKTTDGFIIAPDGYTEGSVVKFGITKQGYDGYIDGYSVATTGAKTPIPPPVYDHIVGYTNSTDGYTDGISTTTLTIGQEETLVKLSDRGDIFVDDGNGIVSTPDLVNIDPRSTTIIDSQGRQIEVIPVENYPIDGGYVVDADGYYIDDNFDNAPIEATTTFTSGGIFNPRASYIQIDGRVDGYINGQPIQPGDRLILNKPFGEIRYLYKKEDLSDAIRKTSGYISGGISSIIWNYEKGEAAFYYWDAHDLRWVVSLQNMTPPDFPLMQQKNNAVLGSVFKWIPNKRQVLPG